jgi:hypothetical protein
VAAKPTVEMSSVGRWSGRCSGRIAAMLLGRGYYVSVCVFCLCACTCTCALFAVAAVRTCWNTGLVRAVRVQYLRVVREIAAINEPECSGTGEPGHRNRGPWQRARPWIRGPAVSRPGPVIRSGRTGKALSFCLGHEMNREVEPQSS